MQTFDIIRKSQPKKSFRVASIIGKFDLQSEEVVEQFIGQFDIPEQWNVGLIVGKSGTGKTTIAKAISSYLNEREVFEDGIIWISMRGFNLTS